MSQSDTSRSINVYLTDGSVDNLSLDEIDSIVFTENTYNYTYVDLGLSVKWATCNIGADSPEDYGYFFAWGETEPKDTYTSSNSTTYGVYMMYDIAGNPDYDAATANWGSDWRLPSRDEIGELVDSCVLEWSKRNGVYGYLITGTNGNSIFLPAAGWYTGSTRRSKGSTGWYWSCTTKESDSAQAFFLDFDQSSASYSSVVARYVGCPVRPVFNENEEDSLADDPPEASGILAATGEINGFEYVDLGLSVKWATCNIGAEFPEDYGYYFAWGETEPEEAFYISNSTTYNQSMYDDISGDSIYDTATVNWGSPWRMPTSAEMQELIDSCTWRWTVKHFVYGYLVTGPSGNSIFLPPAGSINGTSNSGDDSDGNYWSSTPYGGGRYYSYYLYYDDDGLGVEHTARYKGLSVRPVWE